MGKANSLGRERRHITIQRDPHFLIWLNVCVPPKFIGAFQMVVVVKDLLVSARDARVMGSIPGSGRSSWVGSGNPLPYSCLENPMDREAWLATVHGVAWSQIWLSDYHYTQASLTHYFSLFLLIPFLLQLNIFWRTGGSCNLFSL